MSFDQYYEVSSILERVFPKGTFEKPHKHFDYIRIVGLPVGAAPLNANIILSGNENYFDSRGERKEHFLFTAGGYTFFLRICDAMKNSAYAEFLTIHNVVPIDTIASTTLMDSAIRYIKTMCKISVDNRKIFSAISPCMLH